MFHFWIVSIAFPSSSLIFSSGMCNLLLIPPNAFFISNKFSSLAQLLENPRLAGGGLRPDLQSLWILDPGGQLAPWGPHHPYNRISVSLLPKANGGNRTSSALGTDVPCLVSVFTLSSFYTEDTGSERPDDSSVISQ